MKKFLKITSIVLALALVVCFAACGGNTEPEETEAPETETKVLTMATNAEFPPYEFKEGDGYKGIDVEIAEAIAAKLGMELKIEDIAFDSIIPGVQTGKYDMGMAGLTVDETRLKQVNFSDSYATGVQSIIVKEAAISSLLTTLQVRRLVFRQAQQVISTLQTISVKKISQDMTTVQLQFRLLLQVRLTA